ncbi:MAG: arabinan endo-1,5-alpha-L-arabinosidase [Rikenellaceae bacterium]|nr:arabinan endo-1,5-alpha-L-arabinosidase [Rikenellaceae bacterium]
MKTITKLFILAVASVAAISCAEPKRSGNPIFEGWYADPEGVIFGDTYWIYPTWSMPFPEQLHLDAFSSKDLVTWTKHERIIDNNEISWLTHALWAPSIIEKDGKYYLMFSGNNVKQGEVGGIGVAVADTPAGPFKDLLGKPLIQDIINGAQPIDQFVFKDSDGTYYMYYGGWKHCNVCKLNDDFTGFVPFEDGEIFKEITPGEYVEGPFMFIRDGKYYFMWSEGKWRKANYRVAYAIADNPLGPFESRGVILQTDEAIGTGAGHHSVMHNPRSGKYYIVYHRHPIGSTDGNDRRTCIDELHFDAEGNILPVKMTFEGVAADPLK